MRALALENAASVAFLWFVLFEGKDGRQTEVMIQFSARQRPAKSHRREHVTIKKKKRYSEYFDFKSKCRKKNGGG